MRLIDANALPVQKVYAVDEAGFVATYYMVDVEDIKKAPTIEAAPKWIPVTERLPETDTDVLAYCYWHESLQTQVCHLSSNNEGCWYISITGQWTPKVTHWMPLPGPPKMDLEGE